MATFGAAKRFAVACYRATRHLPDYERFNMAQQIRRAAVSVYLNFAEGCSRKSGPERRRYYEVARGSVIEIDTCLDLAVALNYIDLVALKDLKGALIEVFRLLCGLIQSAEDDCSDKT